MIYRSVLSKIPGIGILTAAATKLAVAPAGNSVAKNHLDTQQPFNLSTLALGILLGLAISQNLLDILYLVIGTYYNYFSGGICPRSLWATPCFRRRICAESPLSDMRLWGSLIYRTAYTNHVYQYTYSTKLSPGLLLHDQMDMDHMCLGDGNDMS